VKSIAARIGKSYQTVYREIARNGRPDGRYQPWHAHGQAHLRRRRPRAPRVSVDEQLCRDRGAARQALVAGADQQMVATTLAEAHGLASVPRDDLRRCLSRLGRGPEPTDPAHWPLLSTQAWSGPHSRRCAEAMHEPEVDPRPTCSRRCKKPSGSLGGRSARRHVPSLRGRDARGPQDTPHTARRDPWQLLSQERRGRSGRRL